MRAGLARRSVALVRTLIVSSGDGEIRDELLTFFVFPAEHWQHIRTRTDRINFSTVRLSTASEVQDVLQLDALKVAA